MGTHQFRVEILWQEGKVEFLSYEDIEGVDQQNYHTTTLPISAIRTAHREIERKREDEKFKNRVAEVLDELERDGEKNQ